LRFRAPIPLSFELADPDRGSSQALVETLALVDSVTGFFEAADRRFSWRRGRQGSSFCSAGKGLARHMTSTQATESGNKSAEESFAALFEASLTQTDSLKEGDIVQGSVIKVNRDTVVVDIGYKSEGVIPASEFIDTSGKVSVHPGDRVDVLVEAKENDQGLVALSKEKADKLKVWDEISAACERDELIEGTITARVKGGLQVSIRGGVKAFLPGSQVDLRPVRNLDKLIGQTFEFKVIKFNKKRGNIVLSRRVLLEKERNELKAKTLQQLEEGMVVRGTIKNITEYGAFVDLGGIDGLLHITDMS
jgi:small subunit ribosomal protein S1